jgi:hypothetical protein
MATTYGLNIYNSAASLIYSSADVTWNQVDYFSVGNLSDGSVVSKTYPVIDGKEVLCLQILVDAPPASRRALAHTITVSGTTVSVTGGSENAFILVLMR